MKKIILFFFATAIAIGISGLLVYKFRHHAFITRITDNRFYLNEINQISKATDLFFFPLYFYSNQLPQYALLIDPLDLISLEDSLPKSNQINLVAGFSQKIPATFIDDQGQEYSVKLSYRGNNATHWGYEKKSYRIEFSSSKIFKDLHSLDLIIPEDRGLVLEHLANFRAKNLNLLAPDSWFVNLSINHQPLSIYYATEKIDNDFIDRRNLKGTLFKEKDSTDNWNKSIFKDVQDWRAYPDNPDNPDNPDYQALEKLLLTLNTSESTSEDLLNLIDLDNFLSWQVHSILMASIHQDKSHNNNLFYNHQLNKFQFIPWDTGQRDMISIKLNKLYHPIVDFLLSDPTIIKKRDKLLTDYLLNSTYYQQDIDLFNQSINQIYIPLIQDKQKFYPNIKYIIDIKNYRNWINNYSTILKSQLDSDEKY